MVDNINFYTLFTTFFECQNGSDSKPEQTQIQNEKGNENEKKNNEIQKQCNFIKNFLKRLAENDILQNVCIEIVIIYAIIYLFYLFKRQKYEEKLIYPFFCACFCISNKFLLDLSHENKTFSHFSGIHLSQFNSIEKYILNKINYKLHVPYDKIKKIINSLNNDKHF